MTEYISTPNSHVAISLEAGGAIIQYQTNDNGRVTNWFDPTKYSFPLAPFCNRIDQARFSFADKEYHLKANEPPHSLHGSAWQNLWQLDNRSTNGCTISYQELLSKDSPFSYLIKQHFVLTERSLSVQLRLTNIGEQSLPFGFGLHPYFNCDDDTIIQAETTAMWLTDHRLIPTRLVSNPMVKHLSQGLKPANTRLDNTFSGWKRNAVIEWPHQSCQMEINASDPLNYLAIYSPGNGSLCIEPVSNVPNAFNLMARNQSNHGSRILRPQESIQAQVDFEIYRN